MKRGVIIVLLVYMSMNVFGQDTLKSKIIGKWKVESYIKADSTVKQKATAIYILEFDDKNKYGIKLDRNRCGGIYNCYKNEEIRNIEIIIIEAPECTKVCCDTEYADGLIRILPQMDSYFIIKDTLTLMGNGQIELSWYNK